MWLINPPAPILAAMPATARYSDVQPVMTCLCQGHAYLQFDMCLCCRADSTMDAFASPMLLASSHACVCNRHIHLSIVYKCCVRLQKAFGKCSASFMLDGNFCQSTCGRCPSPAVPAASGGGCTDIQPPGSSFSCTQQVSGIAAWRHVCVTCMCARPRPDLAYLSTFQQFIAILLKSLFATCCKYA